MEKKYIIGGLAIVGALALFAYLKPTSAKRNSGGFFGADGLKMQSSSTISEESAPSWGRWCARRNADRSVNYMRNNYSGTCPGGWKKVTSFGDRTGI